MDERALARETAELEAVFGERVLVARYRLADDAGALPLAITVEAPGGQSA